MEFDLSSMFDVGAQPVQAPATDLLSSTPDVPVTPSAQGGNGILEEMVRNDGNYLAQVSENQITEDLCLIAVSRKGGALQYVPEKFRTKEICLKALQTNGYAIKWFKPEYIDHSICVKAAGKDAGSINFIPEQFKDKEVWLACIRRDNRFVKEVPEDIFESCKEEIIGLIKPENMKFIETRVNPTSGQATTTNPQDKITEQAVKNFQAYIMAAPDKVYTAPDYVFTKEFIQTFYSRYKETEYGKYIYDKFANKGTTQQTTSQPEQQVNTGVQKMQEVVNSMSSTKDTAALKQCILNINNELKKMLAIINGG